jgi:hypothetical protein
MIPMPQKPKVVLPGSAVATAAVALQILLLLLPRDRDVDTHGPGNARLASRKYDAGLADVFDAALKAGVCLLLLLREQIEVVWECTSCILAGLQSIQEFQTADQRGDETVNHGMA